MKKALLISGNIRNLSEVYPSIKESILDIHNPDVFISSWIDTEKTRESLHEGTKNLEDSLSFDEVVELFKPKSFVLEDYSSDEIQKIKKTAISYSHLGPQTGEFNHISFFMMWYMIKRSLDLMINEESKNNIKYHHIFRTRFDLKIHDPLTLPPLQNEIVIPVGYDWRGGINDTFSYGYRDAMIYYCSLFDNIENYLSDGAYFHPESMLRFHLEKSKYKITRKMIKTSLRGINIWEK